MATITIKQKTFLEFWPLSVVTSAFIPQPLRPVSSPSPAESLPVVPVSFTALRAEVLLEKPNIQTLPIPL